MRSVSYLNSLPVIATAALQGCLEVVLLEEGADARLARRVELPPVKLHEVNEPRNAAVRASLRDRNSRKRH